VRRGGLCVQHCRRGVEVEARGAVACSTVDMCGDPPNSKLALIVCAVRGLVSGLARPGSRPHLRRKSGELRLRRSVIKNRNMPVLLQLSYARRTVTTVHQTTLVTAPEGSRQNKNQIGVDSNLSSNLTLK
jgi:hypothetical protein